ncbi:hypothetical protein PGT21_020924 [Puccinia graminis f. sp. tritici]|uniref:Uncharacterized protein n=2 Tax=Puccinia graminis f. sp. tritici TaxID=56615 RepID=E3KUF7_PUCGT|nr:uncharacterized protein PGTG_13854 [Puccinia graminis f. sp. tritici CRL 75-36-700-3]EFP88050.2 hypothetical protein PGTG_13854 [Puccinia graminis f. sp. tritici CRL 75-36-700-3]KAA1108682.1 hypothetical protein PGT21_020924 [Puccinia graminis f. sp. tritici]
MAIITAARDCSDLSVLPPPSRKHLAALRLLSARDASHHPATTFFQLGINTDSFRSRSSLQLATAVNSVFFIYPGFFQSQASHNPVTASNLEYFINTCPFQSQLSLQFATGFVSFPGLTC